MCVCVCVNTVLIIFVIHRYLVLVSLILKIMNIELKKSFDYYYIRSMLIILKRIVIDFKEVAVRK